VTRSEHDLRQLDEDALRQLPEAALRTLSATLLADLEKARERMQQNSSKSSRPPSNRAPWEQPPPAPDPAGHAVAQDDAAHPGAGAPSNIVFVCQAGELAIKAALLAASLRAQLGATPRLFGLEPPLGLISSTVSRRIMAPYFNRVPSRRRRPMSSANAGWLPVCASTASRASRTSGPGWTKSACP
jgi:hypothetical protein